MRDRTPFGSAAARRFVMRMDGTDQLAVDPQRKRHGRRDAKLRELRQIIAVRRQIGGA